MNPRPKSNLGRLNIVHRTILAVATIANIHWAVRKMSDFDQALVSSCERDQNVNRSATAFTPMLMTSPITDR